MNFRKVIFTSILLTMMTLIGCSNQDYDDAIINGMQAVDDEKFKDALDYFEDALNAIPDDDTATTAIEQIDLITKSVEVALDEKTSEAIPMLEKATKHEQGLDTITNKASEMLENVEATDKQLHTIDDLINKNEFNEARELIDETLEKIDGKVYLLPFEKQLTSLEEDIKTAELFTYIEGYSSNDNDGTAVCQITADDLMCNILTVDLYAYEEIKSIKLDSDDTLKLELVDEADLVISNINENSFDMYDRTFKKTTAEDIENHPTNYQTIDDLFNRDIFKDILKNGPGQHDLFEFWQGGKSPSNDNVVGESDQDSSSKLDNYSDEEIEYARVWLDFVNVPTPPQLTVTFNKKGDFISRYAEYDHIVYPEDVTVLLGEYTADGMVTYNSNGDGTINVYDVPSHWHQSSDEAFKEAAEQVLETVTKKDVPTGNDEQVLDILDSMIIDESIQ